MLAHNKTPYQLGKVHCGSCGEFVLKEETYIGTLGRRIHRWCGKMVALDANSGRKPDKPTRDAMPR